MPPSFRSLRASQTSTTYSGTSDIFWPKPPPTSGAMTRRSVSGMPSKSAMPVRIRCGIWVAHVSVTRPDAGSKAAWPARASSGVAFCRRDRISNVISAMRRAHARRQSLGVSILPSTTRLRGASRMNVRRAGVRAPRARRSPAGFWLISTSTSSAMSSASLACSAHQRRRPARRQSAHVRRPGSAAPPAHSRTCAAPA